MTNDDNVDDGESLIASHHRSASDVSAAEAAMTLSRTHSSGASPQAVLSSATSARPVATGRKRIMYLCLGAFANLLWGAYAPLARALQTDGAQLPPISLVIVLSAMAASVFFTFFLGFKRLGLAWLRSRALWTMAVLVLVRALTNISSTTYTTAINSQLIGLLAPFIVAFLSRFWLKDKLPPFTVSALIVSLTGTLLILFGNTQDDSMLANLTWRDAIGIGLQVVSTSAYSVYIVCVKRNRDLGEGPLILSQSLLVFLIGPGISFAIGEDWTRWGLLSGTEIGLVLFWGFGIFTIGASTQILAISKLGSAAMVSVFLPLRLVVALILSVILVDEHLDGAAQICGAVIVLGALAAYLWVNRSANVAQRYDRQVSEWFRRCRRRNSSAPAEPAADFDTEVVVPTTENGGVALLSLSPEQTSPTLVNNDEKASSSST